jgi:processive 1,2-diacylglycerol beta-glucosyltransferase
MPHILLLSEAIGNGHESAARAIEEALMTNDPEVRVTRINLLDTFRPLTAKVTRTLYFQALTHSPALWGRWYEWQREKKWNRVSRLVLRNVLKREVVAWLHHLAPDAVVCTHPLPACFIAELKKQGFSIPLCTVLTDFDLHGYWIHPGIDLYCVPLPSIADEISRRLGCGAQILVTGIPISEKFVNELQNRPPESPPSHKRILIAGGGFGIGVEPMVRGILNTEIPCEITVVCGRNRALYRHLKEANANYPGVRILGFSRQMHKLMAESDLLVTKPGGLTVSEALTMRLPMVLYTPIQGQESRNGRLMQELRVALHTESPDQVTSAVRHLLQHPESMHACIEKMNTIRRPYAARMIANAVLQLVPAYSKKARSS